MAELRVVGGVLGGRRFRGPPGDATRPTSERVREAIASALVARGAIEGAHVLDLYAGTGALAFEMLSRGASTAVCVEADRRVADGLSKNAATLGLDVRVVAATLGDKAARPLESALASVPPATLVLADPPYALAAEALGVISELHARGWVADEAWLVVECASRSVPDTRNFTLDKAYRYGDTTVLLLRLPARDEAPR